MFQVLPWLGGDMARAGGKLMGFWSGICYTLL